MKVYTGIITLFMFFSGTAWSSQTPHCVKAEQRDIAMLFDRWNDSLKTGSAQKVADNYLSEAVLLPTVSNQARLTHEERVDYFEHFLKKKPVGKIDARMILIDCNTAIDTGTYTFTFADKTEVAARYTFTYAWTGSEWKISTHHSSAMPET